MHRVLLASDDVAAAVALAEAWAAGGDTVTAVLVDAAAGSARAGHLDGAALRRALAAGVAVGAHDEALRRRGLEPARLAEGVKVLSIGEIADLVATADRAVWL